MAAPKSTTTPGAAGTSARAHSAASDRVRPAHAANTTHREAVGRAILVMLMDAQPMRWEDIREGFDSGDFDGHVEDTVSDADIALALMDLRRRDWIGHTYAICSPAGYDAARRVASAAEHERRTT